MLSVLILFGVSLIIYVLVRIQPGENFVRTKYSMQLAQDGTGETEQLVSEMEVTYGFKKRLVDDDGNYIMEGIHYTYREVGPFEGYWLWLANILHGDWGDSFIFSVDSGKTEKYYIVEDSDGTHYIPYEKESEIPDGALTQERMIATQSVIRVIYTKCGISFVISLIATIFEFLIAIPLGIISATKQYGVLDYTVTVLAMMGISLPTFFLGALMLKAFSIDLDWFPYAGLVDPNSGLPTIVDNMYHLVLPLSTLIILSIGGLMRYTRTNMLEVLNADYIRTARAKGLSEHSVIYKHAFRNSLIPIVTMLAGILPGLFGGAMITETVFSIDGIGKAAYKAVTSGDIPFIMAYNMFLSLLTVIGTLMSDLMYAVVDPRVKIGD